MRPEIPACAGNDALSKDENDALSNTKPFMGIRLSNADPPRA